MINLHHLANSRSPELLKVHPLGKLPVITEGDLTIAESKRFLDRIHERPAYQRAIEKGGQVEILAWR